MALFKRQKGASDIPPELQPYYDGTTSKGSDKGWLRWLIRGGIGLVILVILALGGTWIWNKIAGDDDAKPASSSITDNNSENSDGRTSSTSTTTPASPNTSGPSTSNPTTSSSQPTQPATNSSASNTAATSTESAEALANTGPTETIALFIVTVVIATLAYQYRLRSQN